MKVILLEDIKGVGKKGQIIDASDGYAVNFLLPKKKAIEATAGNMATLESKKKSDADKVKREQNKAEELAKKINGMEIQVNAKVGTNGKLFGSITNREIAQAMTEKLGIAIDKKLVALDEPIKTLGEKKVEVKIHSGVKAFVNVVIK